MTTEEFLKDISDRLTAIGANVSEERASIHDPH